MKKYLAMLVAAMLCACCLGLAACGGSSASSSASSASGSASASASESASAESASASAASESASASAAASDASASASAAASDEVNPELKAFADEYVAVCDEVVAVAAKAKEAGSYDAVEAEWKEVSEKLNTLSGQAAEWGKKYSSGELTAADKAYYNKVLLPAGSKALSAASDMLDLIEM